MLRRWLIILLAIACVAQMAEARTRHRKRSAFRVALQPFEMVHDAVHAIAAPVAAVVSEPVRVAYYSARPPAIRPPSPGDEVYRAEPVEDDYMDDAGNGSGATEPLAEIESGGSHPMVRGDHAVVQNGVAYAPSNAPQAVKNAIWAVNTIRTRPYIWGGGHGSFHDYGYDCSGTVSFALHSAGAIASPLPSSDLMRFGERGHGRWFTIYSRPGHTFAVIAGLRLDTTDFQRGGNSGPRWHADMRDTSGYVARHPHKL